MRFLRKFKLASGCILACSCSDGSESDQAVGVAQPHSAPPSAAAPAAGAAETQGDAPRPGMSGPSAPGPSAPGPNSRDQPMELITSDDDEQTGNGAVERADLVSDTACAEEAVGTERIPVDLYFMVDTTGSMKCPVPGDPNDACPFDPGPPYSDHTRWFVESTALTDFIESPTNEGIRVGIGFFPSRGRNYCSVDNYVTPAVEIAALPAAAPDLRAAIERQQPDGNTPTVASLTGALLHAAAWAEDNPGREIAVVYSTDGLPVGCRGSTVAGAAAVAADALATAGIRTYVLGMGLNLTGLNQIAAAGGTDAAFLVDTGMNAAEQLSEALGSIRNATRNCTFTVPMPPEGKQLDYDQVNVRYTTTAGEVIDVQRDPSMTECNQGWQYSADQTQINLCGDLCETVKQEADGMMQILLGCKTRIGTAK